jgi:DnaJ-class molecular chaperone
MGHVLEVLRQLSNKEGGVVSSYELKPTYIDNVECAFCKGSGTNPYIRAKCPICGGSGEVRVQPPVVRCAFCHGRGRPLHANNPRLSCPVCFGKGVATVREPIELCPKCCGRGKSLTSGIYCMHCRGKGAVSTEVSV